MTTTQHAWLLAIFLRLTQPAPKYSASDYCCQYVRFNDPGCTGMFSLAGREYMREWVDNWGNPDVTDQVVCAGTRLGKTITNHAGMAYAIAHESARFLNVRPKTNGAAGANDEARTRFIPMIRATPKLAALIPTKGQSRHGFKTPQQMLGGCIIDWAGSNSVSALASNRCRFVVQAEIDKFNTTRRRDEEGNICEADAVDLADERCKEFSNPKRFKESTPTLPGGRIWQELLKSDLRRYFVPCPHCDNSVILAWSKEYTVLPKVGCEAFIRWDPKAKAANGVWDYERVEASAHMVCPHCAGKILDTHKAEMVRRGEWRATQKGLPGYRGYHLPSMYAAHQQCNFGKMAVRFLKAVHSLDGPRGFINSDLAEPYAAQDVAAARIERVSKVEVGSEWRKLMTVDCQQKAPHFWFIVRAYGGKDIIGLKGGSTDTWDELRAVQLDQKVPDAGVIVDSGYGSQDDAEVYRVCASYGQLYPGQFQKLIHIGWMPAKGMPGRRRWRDPKTNLFVPWYYRPTDPYMGTAEAGKVEIQLFEFAAEFFKDRLQALREQRDKRYHWSISAELDNDEYHEHMRGQVRREVIRYARTVIEWERRHRHSKDHLFACEYQQVAAATALGFLEAPQPEKK